MSYRINHYIIFIFYNIPRIFFILQISVMFIWALINLMSLCYLGLNFICSDIFIYFGDPLSPNPSNNPIPDLGGGGGPSGGGPGGPSPQQHPVPAPADSNEEAGPSNASSSLTQDTDTENNPVNDRGSVNGSETAEELVERFKNNPEGLENYFQEKHNEITQKSRTEAREWLNIHDSDEIEDIMDSLGEEARESRRKLNAKYIEASKVLDELDTYSDWTTDKANSSTPNSPSSNQDTNN
jgi:hypothetical protein